MPLLTFGVLGNGGSRLCEGRIPETGYPQSQPESEGMVDFGFFSVDAEFHQYM
jgi:hypothetical protein